LKRFLASTAIAMTALMLTPAAASASMRTPSAAVGALACPVFDLPAVYDAGAGPIQPMIHAVNVDGSFTIDMVLFGRPNATGVVTQCDTILVSFPDDNSYTAVLEAPDTVRWSNGTVWYKLAYVPEVTNRYENTATVAIVNAGLVKGAVSRPPSCNPRVIGRVRNQFPLAFTHVRMGTPVNLTIPRQGPNCP
jgi:hypothetical protein